jgi:hypothetical protein
MITLLLVLTLAIALPFTAATIGHARHAESRARGGTGLGWLYLFHAGEFCFRWGWRETMIAVVIWAMP